MSIPQYGEISLYFLNFIFYGAYAVKKQNGICTCMPDLYRADDCDDALKE